MHLALDDVAARALLAGDAAAARELVAPVVEADPRSRGAQLVASASATSPPRSGRGARSVRGANEPRDEAVPFAAFAACARSLRGGEAAVDGARAPCDVAREAVDAGDALLTPIAADLAARGVARDTDLSADARIELAARGGDAAALAALAAPVADTTRGPDARHRLLALSSVQPVAPATRALALRLAPAASVDSVVAVALTRLAALENTAVLPAAQARLELIAPVDPLAAATLVASANRRGDAAAAARARMYLAPLAVTDAERALSRGATAPGATPAAEAR